MDDIRPDTLKVGHCPTFVESHVMLHERPECQLVKQRAVQITPTSSYLVRLRIQRCGDKRALEAEASIGRPPIPIKICYQESLLQNSYRCVNLMVSEAQAGLG